MSGTAAVTFVTFTKDDGLTLASSSEPLKDHTYLHELIALDAPNTLLASGSGGLLRSTDAGCTWTLVSDLPSLRELRGLTTAQGGQAYGWLPSYDPRQEAPMIRITPSGPVRVPSPVHDFA